MVAKFNSKICLERKVFLYFEPICADLASKFAKSGFKVLIGSKKKI
jgi:hypothetical protein